MASSSDWIEQAGKASNATPDWLAAMSGRGGFIEGAPFAASPTLAPVSQANEVPPFGPDEDAVSNAFEQGEAKGRAEAEAEAQAALAQQRALRLAFREFDQAALDSLAAELAETVVSLCGQVLGECAIDRDALLERCAVAATRIGSGAGQCALHLHPDDIALIGEESLGGWQVTADAALERGALLLEGPDGAVRDGPAEWRRAIEAAIRG
ncbi:MAG: FliH/SctL family protein [Pseudomonadota bacterium]